MAEEKTAIDSAIEWVKKKGFSKIKAQNVAEFEDTSSFTISGGSEVVAPEITAIRNGRKSYFDIANKEEDKQRLISKWKLYEQLARLKDGSFFIFVPFGLKAFTERIIKKHNIQAKLVTL